MDFLNRKSELAALEREYQRQGFSFVVVYGRRRVGKTRLLKEFLHQKLGLYFLANTQLEPLNIKHFQDKAAEVLADEVLPTIEFGSWFNVMRYVIRALESKGERYVLVIDEFQYLVQVNSAVPSIFQGIVDEVLAASNGMLILCGSLISLMYSSVLSAKSPLYGRRTAQIRIRPFDFETFNLWCPQESRSRQIELYSVLSGVPKYMELFESSADLMEAITVNFCDPSSFFYAEPRFLLQEEVSENKMFFSILQMMAFGEHKLGRIAARLGVSTANITSFLQKLRDLDIVERQVPVLEQRPEKSKKGLYFIMDHYLRFWFTYIFPMSSDLELGRTELAIKRIRSTFAKYCAHSFEAICLELARKKVDFPVVRAGRQWDRSSEVDVVVLGESDLLVGECKWSNSAIGMNVLKGLQAKVERWDQDLLQGRSIRYAVFSKSGFTPELHAWAQRRDVWLESFDSKPPF